MSASLQQIDSFHQFAIEKVSRSDTDFALDELWDLWRLENPTPDECAENIAAIQAAVDDMEKGDRGLPFDEHVRELRDMYNLPQD